ncbi:hypothetical protein FA743_18335 [Paracoccus gahaiensis]|uniref:Uncharacterized protein n=1 Tax=Paracoccus gahaiensis TaxID=1706839 RepID=A0A4U0R459_9RHOB|nr:hypothetical protein [Paracoccus gahaiensis]TJZ89575.1 hypothetical protein FA743_18335 [Paracoccus gahaiensis]
MFIEVTERDTNSPISIGVQHIVSFAPRAPDGTNLELVGSDDWVAVVEEYAIVKHLISTARSLRAYGMTHLPYAVPSSSQSQTIPGE